MEGGRLIEGGGGALIKFSFQRTVTFLGAKFIIEKQKLQHYPRKQNVNVNVFRLLKQWLIVKHTVLPLYTKKNSASTRR